MTKEKTRCKCGYEPSGFTDIEKCPICKKKIKWGKDLTRKSEATSN